jgi:hypothetical protein
MSYDDQVDFVGIVFEVKPIFYEELGSDDRNWIRTHNYIVSIRGETQEFLNKLGRMNADGCTQKLIGLLKYARDNGAAWIKFL